MTSTDGTTESAGNKPDRFMEALERVLHKVAGVHHTGSGALLDALAVEGLTVRPAGRLQSTPDGAETPDLPGAVRAALGDYTRCACRSTVVTNADVMDLIDALAARGHQIVRRDETYEAMRGRLTIVEGARDLWRSRYEALADGHDEPDGGLLAALQAALANHAAAAEDGVSDMPDVTDPDAFILALAGQGLTVLRTETLDTTERVTRETIERVSVRELDTWADVHLLGRTVRSGRLTASREIPGFLDLVEPDGPRRAINPTAAVFEIEYRTEEEVRGGLRDPWTGRTVVQTANGPAADLWRDEDDPYRRDEDDDEDDDTEREPDTVRGTPEDWD